MSLEATISEDPFDGISQATQKPIHGGKNWKREDGDQETSLQQRRVCTIAPDAEPPGHRAQDHEPDDQRYSTRRPEPVSHFVPHIWPSVASSGVLSGPPGKW